MLQYIIRFRLANIKVYKREGKSFAVGHDITQINRVLKENNFNCSIGRIILKG